MRMLIAVLALLLVLVGCGQRGPLERPESDAARPASANAHETLAQRPQD